MLSTYTSKSFGTTFLSFRSLSTLILTLLILNSFFITPRVPSASSSHISTSYCRLPPLLKQLPNLQNCTFCATLSLPIIIPFLCSIFILNFLNFHTRPNSFLKHWNCSTDSAISLVSNAQGNWLRTHTSHPCQSSWLLVPLSILNLSCHCIHIDAE